MLNIAQWSPRVLTLVRMSKLKRPSEKQKRQGIYLCIQGHRFNRKLLRHAAVDRYDFKLWCERRDIPLPEFWFPPSWKLEYELPEDDIHPGHWYVRKDWTAEDWAAWREVQDKAAAVPSAEAGENSQVVDDTPVESRPPLNEGPPPDAKAKREDSAEKLRPNQNARIACQQIASVIWKNEPNRTIASVIKDEVIQKYGGAAPFADETVREWLKHVAPPDVRSRRGRPKKGSESE